MLDEQANVAGALAQRRKMNGKHIDAIEEVFAKPFVVDFLLKIAIGGGKEADLYAAFLDRADAAKRAVFEDSQQLRLQIECQLADFVDEERAAVRHFE